MTFLDFWLENRESASLIVSASEVVHSSLTSNTNSMSYFIRIRRNRELPAMPTSQRTNEFFSPLTRTHERLVLWRFIIIISGVVTPA